MARPDPELKRASPPLPAGLTLSVALALGMHAVFGLLLNAELGLKTQPARTPPARSAPMMLRVAEPIKPAPPVVLEPVADLAAAELPKPSQRDRPPAEPPLDEPSNSAAEHLIEHLSVPVPDAPIPSGKLHLRALLGQNPLGQWVIAQTQSGRERVAFVRALRDGLEALSPEFAQVQVAAQPQLCLDVLFEEQQAVKVRLMKGAEQRGERCLSELGNSAR
jgi:hypothetical protein